MILTNVKEPDFNQWTMNWADNGYDEKTGTVTHRFCPRPYHGGDLLEGFTVSIDIESIDTWNNLEAKLFRNEEFIQKYFGEFRLSFAPEKQYFKLVKHFGQYYDDCPIQTNAYDFGKLTIPRDYLSKIRSIVGDMSAWDYK